MRAQLSCFRAISRENTHAPEDSGHGASSLAKKSKEGTNEDYPARAQGADDAGTSVFHR